MVGIYCGSGLNLKCMAPYGGIDPVIDSNPFAFAAPIKGKQPFVLDFSTAKISYGKVMVAKAKDQSVPDNCIINKEGKVTNDPGDFYSLFPFGDDSGFKGFGLAMMIDVLASILSRAGVEADENTERVKTGFMIAMNIEHYLSLEQYYEQMDSIVGKVKSSKPRPGFNEILLPGEHSAKNREQQEKEGILMDRGTMVNVIELAKDFGVEVSSEVFQAVS